MSLLAILPLAIGAVLAAELVFFGVIRPGLRRRFLPSTVAGFGIVAAWLAANHASLAGAVAGASLALAGHAYDLWARRG